MIPVQKNHQPSRRHLLAGGAGVVLGTATLAACGGGGDGAGSGTEPASGSGSSSASTGGAGSLAEVSDVPVGGAVSATDADGNPVIVSQPTAGKIVAFSAVCTHRGCTVAPQGDVLECPCHGSTYDAATGEVTGGPAPDPLPSVDVRVRKGRVLEA